MKLNGSIRQNLLSCIYLSFIGIVFACGAPNAPPDACLDSLISFEALDITPKAIRKNAPVYPVAAIRVGWEGDVGAQLYIDLDGTVCHSEITLSSEREDVDDAVLEATRQWLLEPARLNGEAVRTTIEATVKFRLTD